MTSTSLQSGKVWDQVSELSVRLYFSYLIKLTEYSGHKVDLADDPLLVVKIPSVKEVKGPWRSA